MDAAFASVYSVLSPFGERLNFGEKERDAIANDLSEGGVSLLTDYPLPTGTQINLRFRLLNEKETSEEKRSRKFRVRGAARYCVLTKEKSYRVGVRFINLSHEDQAFIARHQGLI